MMAGFIPAEIQTGRKRDMLGFQEMTAEREGIAAERADIRVQIERTFRLYRNAEPQLTQCRQQEVPTSTEFGAPRFQNAQGLRGCRKGRETSFQSLSALTFKCKQLSNASFAR